MKKQLNEIKRMQQLANVKVLKENQINTLQELEAFLKQYVGQYLEDFIGEAANLGGDDLNWGKSSDGESVSGYSKTQAIEDFIEFFTGEYGYPYEKERGDFND